MEQNHARWHSYEENEATQVYTCIHIYIYTYIHVYIVEIDYWMS